MTKVIRSTSAHTRIGGLAHKPIRGNAVVRALGALACPAALGLALCASLALAGDATPGASTEGTDIPAAASATANQGLAAETATPALPSSGAAEDALDRWEFLGDTPRGVGSYVRDDGGMRLETPYYTVDIPASSASGISYRYADKYLATVSGKDKLANDPETWRVVGQTLTILKDGDSSGAIMIYLNKAGEKTTEPVELVPGQSVRDLGEAAVGNGWHVIISAFSDPAVEGSFKEAEQRLDEAAEWVSLSGMSSEPPTVPDDIEPIVGG